GVAVAAADNGEGGAGVCPGCSLLPALLAGAAGPTPGLGFQVTDQEMADIFVDLVDLGAWVISNSWGPAGEDPSVDSTSFPAPPLPALVGAAFDYAESTGRGGLGTVILYAAGNSNQDAVADTYLVHENVVAVGAVDDQGLKSYYSNYGQTLDVAAPSNGGLNGITTTSAGPDSATDPAYTDSFGGTSSACPFAAGVVGLILSANPALTATEARQILFDSADPIDPVWGDWAAGFSRYYGHGRVNAFTAVSLALGTCADPADCPAPSDVCAGSCDGAGCAPCRTALDCAAGYACQALPALGASYCVAAGVTVCDEGLDLVNGHCLPTRAACGLCDQAEACDGRDDDCNGEVDDGLDCEGSPRCLQQGWGCPAEMNCAGTSCRDACQNDGDCEDEGQCKMAKNRYGQLQPAEPVCSGGSVGCEMGCEVLASSLVDEELDAFADCADEATCQTIMGCAMLLPINF
ncbi:MAG TPA: S8 family serine peptidase, partial [Polyangia bacterium]|nr:S8 family serine peptidase [Polyangia bacterium]